MPFNFPESTPDFNLAATVPTLCRTTTCWWRSSSASESSRSSRSWPTWSAPSSARRRIPRQQQLQLEVRLPTAPHPRQRLLLPRPRQPDLSPTWSTSPNTCWRPLRPSGRIWSMNKPYLITLPNRCNRPESRYLDVHTFEAAWTKYKNVLK